MHYPKNNFMSINDISSSRYREKYTKSQRLSSRFSSGAKIFGHVSHSTELVRVCLACQTSTAPIGFPIICMRSQADICEQRETISSFGSADVSGAEKRDEPLRMSAWEATHKVVSDIGQVWHRLAC